MERQKECSICIKAARLPIYRKYRGKLRQSNRHKEAAITGAHGFGACTAAGQDTAEARCITKVGRAQREKIDG